MKSSPHLRAAAAGLWAVCSILLLRVPAQAQTAAPVIIVRNADPANTTKIGSSILEDQPIVVEVRGAPGGGAPPSSITVTVTTTSGASQDLTISESSPGSGTYLSVPLTLRDGGVRTDALRFAPGSLSKAMKGLGAVDGDTVTMAVGGGQQSFTVYETDLMQAIGQYDEAFASLGQNEADAVNKALQALKRPGLPPKGIAALQNAIRFAKYRLKVLSDMRTQMALPVGQGGPDSPIMKYTMQHLYEKLIQAGPDTDVRSIYGEESNWAQQFRSDRINANWTAITTGFAYGFYNAVLASNVGTGLGMPLFTLLTGKNAYGQDATPEEIEGAAEGLATAIILMKVTPILIDKVSDAIAEGANPLGRRGATAPLAGNSSGVRALGGASAAADGAAATTVIEPTPGLGVAVRGEPVPVGAGASAETVRLSPDSVPQTPVEKQLFQQQLQAQLKQIGYNDFVAQGWPGMALDSGLTLNEAMAGLEAKINLEQGKFWEPPAGQTAGEAAKNLDAYLEKQEGRTNPAQRAYGVKNMMGPNTPPEYVKLAGEFKPSPAAAIPAPAPANGNGPLVRIAEPGKGGANPDAPTVNANGPEVDRNAPTQPAAPSVNVGGEPIGSGAGADTVKLSPDAVPQTPVEKQLFQQQLQARLKQMGYSDFAAGGWPGMALDSGLTMNEALAGLEAMINLEHGKFWEPPAGQTAAEAAKNLDAYFEKQEGKTNPAQRAFGVKNLMGPNTPPEYVKLAGEFTPSPAPVIPAPAPANGNGPLVRIAEPGKVGADPDAPTVNANSPGVDRNAPTQPTAPTVNVGGEPVAGAGASAPTVVLDPAKAPQTPMERALFAEQLRAQLEQMGFSGAAAKAWPGFALDNGLTLNEALVGFQERLDFAARSTWEPKPGQTPAQVAQNLDAYFQKMEGKTNAAQRAWAIQNYMGANTPSEYVNLAKDYQPASPANIPAPANTPLVRIAAAGQPVADPNAPTVNVNPPAVDRNGPTQAVPPSITIPGEAPAPRASGPALENPPAAANGAGVAYMPAASGPALPIPMVPGGPAAGAPGVPEVGAAAAPVANTTQYDSFIVVDPSGRRWEGKGNAKETVDGLVPLDPPSATGQAYLWNPTMNSFVYQTGPYTGLPTMTPVTYVPVTVEPSPFSGTVYLKDPSGMTWKGKPAAAPGVATDVVPAGMVNFNVYNHVSYVWNPTTQGFVLQNATTAGVGQTAGAMGTMPGGTPGIATGGLNLPLGEGPPPATTSGMTGTTGSAGNGSPPRITVNLPLGAEPGTANPGPTTSATTGVAGGGQPVPVNGTGIAAAPAPGASVGSAILVDPSGVRWEGDLLPNRTLINVRPIDPPNETGPTYAWNPATKTFVQKAAAAAGPTSAVNATAGTTAAAAPGGNYSGLDGLGKAMANLPENNTTTPFQNGPASTTAPEGPPPRKINLPFGEEPGTGTVGGPVITVSGGGETATTGAVGTTPVPGGPEGPSTNPNPAPIPPPIKLGGRQHVSYGPDGKPIITDYDPTPTAVGGNMVPGGTSAGPPTNPPPNLVGVPPGTIVTMPDGSQAMSVAPTPTSAPPPVGSGEATSWDQTIGDWVQVDTATGKPVVPTRVYRGGKWVNYAMWLAKQTPAIAVTPAPVKAAPAPTAIVYTPSAATTPPAVAGQSVVFDSSVGIWYKVDPETKSTTSSSGTKTAWDPATNQWMVSINGNNDHPETPAPAPTPAKPTITYVNPETGQTGPYLPAAAPTPAPVKTVAPAPAKPSPAAPVVSTIQYPESGTGTMMPYVPTATPTPTALPVKTTGTVPAKTGSTTPIVITVPGAGTETTPVKTTPTLTKVSAAPLLTSPTVATVPGAEPVKTSVPTITVPGTIPATLTTKTPAPTIPAKTVSPAPAIGLVPGAAPETGTTATLSSATKFSIVPGAEPVAAPKTLSPVATSTATPTLTLPKAPGGTPTLTLPTAGAKTPTLTTKPATSPTLKTTLPTAPKKASTAETPLTIPGVPGG